MDEKTLIGAVAAHRSLYDPTHIKYKDVELRNSIWQIIAEDVKTEVESCKAKWRTLRDGFTRALRHQRDTKNISSSKMKKSWRYQSEMEFLIPFIYTRESRSNQLEVEQEEDDHDSSTKTNSPRTDGDDVPFDSKDTFFIASSVMEKEPPSPSPMLLPVNLVNVTPSSSSLKRKFELADSNSCSSMEYWSCRRQEIDALMKEREMNSPRPAHCQCRYPTDDPTEAFFFSMGQSVKRLPFYLQAQVKMKVCQLVTDAEIECLDSASVR